MFGKKYTYLSSEETKAALDGSIVVLDVESNGLSRHSRPISIGAVKLVQGKIYLNNIFHAILPFQDRNATTLAIHEVMASTDVDEMAVLDALLDYIGQDPIAGYGISQDLRLLERWAEKILTKSFRFTQTCIDVMHMVEKKLGSESERMVGGKSNLQFDQLVKRFGLPKEARHTAEGDALNTAWLLQKLLNY